MACLRAGGSGCSPVRRSPSCPAQHCCSRPRSRPLSLEPMSPHRRALPYVAPRASTVTPGKLQHRAGHRQDRSGELLPALAQQLLASAKWTHRAQHRQVHADELLPVLLPAPLACERAGRWLRCRIGGIQARASGCATTCCSCVAPLPVELLQQSLVRSEQPPCTIKR